MNAQENQVNNEIENAYRPKCSCYSITEKIGDKPIRKEKAIIFQHDERRKPAVSSIKNAYLNKKYLSIGLYQL